MLAPERSATADRKQTHEVARLAKRLRHATGRAIADYNLIGDGNRVVVCLSGGEVMFHALCHVAPSQLADPQLFDFAALGSRNETPPPDAHAWLAGEAGAGSG